MILHSNSKKINDFIQIKLGRKAITRMNYLKYLGVSIDSTLSWKPHVTELSKKLSRNCAIFFKIRYYVNPETLRLLYYSLFYSFLSYGVSVWGLTHPTILDPIVMLQKKVVRAITFQDKHAHSTPLFFQLKTLKLFDIHSLHLLCFVYDCIKGQSLACFGEIFTPLQSMHQHFTHQVSKGNIFMERVNTTQYGKRSVRYAGAMLWNALPVCMRESSSKVVLEKNLQKWYLESYLVLL